MNNAILRHEPLLLIPELSRRTRGPAGWCQLLLAREGRTDDGLDARVLRHRSS